MYNIMKRELKKYKLEKEKQSLQEWLDKIKHNNPYYDDGFLQEWINEKLMEIEKELKKLQDF